MSTSKSKRLQSIILSKGQAIEELPIRIYNLVTETRIYDVSNHSLQFIVTDKQSKINKLNINGIISNDNKFFKITIPSSSTFSLGEGEYLYKIIVKYPSNNLYVNEGDFIITSGVEQSWIH